MNIIASEKTSFSSLMGDKEQNNSSIISSLRNVDWSFPSRKRGYGIESLHPYPAKFISEIPGAILDVLKPLPGTVVLDPFCGSGTTLFSAQKRSLPSIGIDLNPIACLISRVKTSPTPPDLEDDAELVIQQAIQNKIYRIPNIPNLNHWFKPEIQEAASAIVAAISERAESSSFDALRLALSSILVKISNQESDTRYAAIHKNIKKDDVYSAFRMATAKLSGALKERDWPISSAKVIERDVLQISREDIGSEVGMVITSPPYPNAYEYWLYHKYRMWWLGFDPIAVKEAEIGARAHFFKKDRHTVDHFRDQMRGVFDMLNSVLSPNGVVCFVVGRSKIHGTIVDNAATVREVGEEIGLKFEARIERAIAANRKSFNLSHANIKTESIVVLSK